MASFAIFSASDGSLTFYNRNVTIPAVNSTFDGRVVSAVYTGFDTATYTAVSQVPWNGKMTTLKTVSFADETTPVSTAYWFSGASNLTTFNSANLNTSAVKDMSFMFQQCGALTTLNLSNWNTGAVTSMRNTFDRCSALTTLNISNWDTGEVKSFERMFQGCVALGSLDLSRWDVSKVTSMAYMFMSNSTLGYMTITSIGDTSNWKTGEVRTMQSMFSYCASLSTVGVTNWDVSKVENMQTVFRACQSLTALDVSKWDTSSCANMYGMFEACSSLTALDVSSWDVSKVTDMTAIFTGLNKLEKFSFGENFSFDGGGNITDASKKAVLPTPSATYIEGADGNWYNFIGEGYSAAGMANAPAGTYYASLDLVRDINVQLKNGTLVDIADSIRLKTGSSARMVPGDMSERILSISSGEGGGGEMPDEYVVLFNKTFEAAVLNTDAWGGESHIYGFRHFWTTDVDGNDVDADGIYARIHVPAQTGDAIVSSGELALHVGQGKPSWWGSWRGNDQQQPYIGWSSFVSTNGQEVWCTYDIDLRSQTYKSKKTANKAAYSTNFQAAYESVADSFPAAVAENKWEYWSGAEVWLVSGGLPAGTNILIYARKRNPDKVGKLPKWSVVT